MLFQIIISKSQEKVIAYQSIVILICLKTNNDCPVGLTDLEFFFALFQILVLQSIKRKDSWACCEGNGSDKEDAKKRLAAHLLDSWLPTSY